MQAAARMTAAEFQALKGAIAARLKGVCESWPPELFETLVDQVASITAKYEHGGGLATYDRRATERMIGELKAATRKSEDPA